MEYLDLDNKAGEQWMIKRRKLEHSQQHESEIHSAGKVRGDPKNQHGPPIMVHRKSSAAVAAGASAVTAASATTGSPSAASHPSYNAS